MQDELKVNDKLIINYGLRYDKMNEVVDASQLSPRVGLVYKATPSTTLHAGYARYFTPPPLELIAPTTVAQFNNTTNQAASPQNSPVQPERSHYFDIGVTQRVTSAVTVGVDAYYKKATDLLDEGQFGTALINTPYNYQTGHDYGVEFTANYKDEHFSAYANLALSRATGENIISGQFNFSPDQLAYIASHPVNLDHDQLVTGSAGIAYTFARTTYSADTTFGSGLRSGFANTDHVPFYVNVNTSRLSITSRRPLSATLMDAWSWSICSIAPTNCATVPELALAPRSSDRRAPSTQASRNTFKPPARHAAA